MSTEDLKEQVNALQEQVTALRQELTVLKDIEEIQKLQRAYGYYLENWMTDEVYDLFADHPETVLLVHAGEFKGKEGVRKFFRPRGDTRGTRPKDFFHQVMQLSPIVHISESGDRAYGRWYGFGANASPTPDGVYMGWMNGVYENEYIKQDGTWKILKLGWRMYMNAPFHIGWVKKDRQCDPDFQHQPPQLGPDGSSEDTFYPSGYICPMHFRHPVTGEETPLKNL